MATATPDSTVRQRKAKDNGEELDTKLVPDTELPSEDENNLFAGTPAEKARAGQQKKQDNKDKNNSKKNKGGKSARAREEADDDGYSPWLDVLRVITFLVVASCGISYVMSGGESWTWGYNNKPRYLRTSYWKSMWNGPINLTPAELSQYDGTDPSKPIYLAINHTIFDVSSNPRVYGQGGSYNVFAGYDASRGFVTGCFMEDRTPDMRGVEEMYLPLDDPETDSFWPYEELEEMRGREMQAALQKVHDGLAHWVRFFGDSDKYHEVGRVALPKDWLAETPWKALCERAQKGRSRRMLPHEVEEAARRKQEKKEKKRREKEEKLRQREEERKEEEGR